MFENSLLQRIALGDEGAQRSLDPDPDRVRLSIQQHLQNLFNVRQGSVSSLPDYGLPDFNDLDMSTGYGTAVTEVRKAIRESLERYEPRLTQVKVRYLRDDDNPLDLRFEITAKLALSTSPARVRFETQLGNEALVKVRG